MLNAEVTRFSLPLALRRRGWHEVAMKPVRKNTRAGGGLLALALVAGLTGGIIAGQASIGLLVGGAIGMVALVAVWALDRRSNAQANQSEP